VKTGGFQTSELTALLEMARRHPGLRPLIVCGGAGRATAARAGVEAIARQEFLLGGPPRASRS
jgi:hypothetical protein